MEWPPKVEIGDRPKRVRAGGAFINPYNFIRTPRRPTEDDHPLADSPPKHRDTYQEDRYSGEIPITITARSPILLPDQAAATPPSERGGTETPRIIETRRRFDDETPLLLGSSVKGMLRSAFEAITNSRFGVFNKDTRSIPGSLRRSPSAALSLLPGWVVSDDGEKPQLAVRRFRYRDYNGRKVLNVPLLNTRTGERFAQTIRPGAAIRETPGLLDKLVVYAWLELREHRTGRYCFWNVVSMSQREDDFDPSRPLGEVSKDGQIAPILVQGIIHWTDSDFVRGRDHKHYERLIPMRIIEPRAEGEFDENEYGRKATYEFRLKYPTATRDQVLRHLEDVKRQIQEKKEEAKARRQAGGAKRVFLDEVPVSSDGVKLKWQAILEAYQVAAGKPAAHDNRPGRYVTAPKAWQLSKGRTFFVDIERGGPHLRRSPRSHRR